MTAYKLHRTDLPKLLADNPNRLAHIQTVLALADQVESVLPHLGGTLKQAALYHDIAYAPPYRRHGFHPLDAALLAEEHGLDAEIVTAIKHHSCAADGIITLDERLGDIRRRHAHNPPLLQNMDNYEPIFRRIVEELPKRYPGITPSA